MQEKFTENRNFQEMRCGRGWTLAKLAELSGYSIATLNALELRGEGSMRLKKKVLSLLTNNEENFSADQLKYWKERCMENEKKLQTIKSALQNLLDNI